MSKLRFAEGEELPWAPQSATVRERTSDQDILLNKLTFALPHPRALIIWGWTAELPSCFDCGSNTIPGSCMSAILMRNFNFLLLFVFKPSVSLYHQPLLSQEGFFTLDFNSQHFNFPPRHHSRDWDFLIILHTGRTFSSRKQWSYIAPLEVSIQYKPCWLLPKMCFETFSIHLENAQVTAICPLRLAMDFLPCEQVWTKEK